MSTNYRLNNYVILDLIRWIIFSPTLYSFHLDIFSRTRFYLNMLIIFISVCPYRLHNETIFAESGITERSMTVSIYKRYVINPISRYPLNILSHISLKCIITNTNCLQLILLWHFDRMLLMIINRITNIICLVTERHYRSFN